MNCKAVIWDLDGTLLDTLEDLTNATNFALRQWQMPVRSIDEVRRFVGNGVRRLMTLAVPEGEANPHFEAAYQTFREYYVEHCQDTTKLYPGIMEALKTLRNDGYRQAIVSNKLQAGVSELQHVWFDGVIDVAIGERPEVRRKPAPDMVLEALRQLGCDASDAVYIGDSDVDIATAANAGVPCISVLWGFRDEAFLKAHGAKTLVAHPQEIVELLSQEL